MAFQNGDVLTAEDLNAVINDTGWIPITLAPGISPTNENEAPMVRKKNGVIYARGAVSSTGIATNGTTTIGYLPPGFRPVINSVFRAGTSIGNAAATLFMSATGDIQIRTNSTASAYFHMTSSWLED